MYICKEHVIPVRLWKGIHQARMARVAGLYCEAHDRLAGAVSPATPASTITMYI